MDWLVPVGVAAGIGWLVWRLVRLLRSTGGRTGVLRDRLLLLCRNDHARVDRLVQAERSRSPGLSEAEACRRAIHRLEMDTGR